MNHDKQNRNLWNRIRERGYYIVLTLCAVAIGVSGYLYYRNVNGQDEVNPGNPSQQVSGEQNAVAVIGTTPGGSSAVTPTSPTQPSEPTQPSTPAVMSTGWPLEGDTAATYAMEALAYNQTTRDWRVHDGIDLVADVGSQVKAAADGTVYTVYEDDSMGVTVVIRHDNDYATTYSSLSQDVRVKAGDTVKMGQVIGAIGETALVETALGPHLHFAVNRKGVSVDPAEFLGE